MKEFIISPNESNQRLDRFLMKLMPAASKGFIQKMIRKKNIKCNGQKSNPSQLLEEGDHILIYFSDQTFAKFSPPTKASSVKVSCQQKLDIVAESPSLLVINKPANLLTQPDHSGQASLIDLALDYLIATGAYDPQKEITFRPACSNRLDRNTTGIVLIPKDYKTLQTINGLIRQKKVKKYYLALVAGLVESPGRCLDFGTKDQDANRTEVSDGQLTKDSLIMELNYQPLESRSKTSLLKIDLLTGRSHQIRAQLAHLGHPILGDPKYGRALANQKLKGDDQITSQLLHANHYLIPALDYNFSAPPPASFLRLAEELGYHYFSLKEE